MTLSPQMLDYSVAWATEDDIGFDVLTDLGNGVARTYGLTHRLPEDLVALYRDQLKVDLVRFNGDVSWELPVSATFVVGRDGKIKYAAGSPDYTRRPEPTDLLPVLDELGGSG